MTNDIDHATALRYARIAGILYLVIIVCAGFSEGFVRAGAIVPGDAAATADNIVRSASLFRLGFASDLIAFLSDIAVAVLLYALLKPVNQTLALLTVFFRLAQSAILGINLLNHFTPIMLLSGTGYLNAFEPAQLQALAMLFLEMHGYGYLISGVFFGLHCFFLGYLLYRSDYFPRILGILMVGASFAYLIDCFTNFLAPDLAPVTEWLVVTMAVIAELSFALWLLIKGVRPQVKG
ncbi:MAG: DUF4386 domain-containing protein [Saprospiraceae bacterium]|nr:DUF4386 domain-containing protein [Saprospiraceae bacterium]